MAVNFPDSPSNGDSYTVNGITYFYNSSKGLWKDSVTAPSVGITEIDQYRLTANITSTQDITGSLERVDDASFSKIGTGMTHNSGVFTFPVTGLYEIITTATFYANTDDAFMALLTQVSTNAGTDWDYTVDAISLYTGKTGRMTVGPGINYVNVTDTTNVVVKFTCNSIVSGNYLEGNTDINRTSFTFKRLGDSQ